LGGMPPFRGFFLKLYVFETLVEGGMVWVALALAVSSVVALSYYHGMSFQAFIVGVGRPMPWGRPLSRPQLYTWVLSGRLLGAPLVILLVGLPGG